MSNTLVSMISSSFLETIIMVLVSGGIGSALGIPLGILLFVTDKKSFMPMPKFHFCLAIVISHCSAHDCGCALHCPYCGNESS